MKARDVMSSPALGVPPTATTEAVALLLVAHGIASAPVLDEAGRPLGVVDEAGIIAAGDGADAAAAMRPVGVTVHPDTPVAELVAEIASTSGRGLLVVDDDGHVSGVVSRRDVLRRVARGELHLAPATAPSASPGAVVVGVDGTAGSAPALRWAAEEARRRGVALHAVIAAGRPDLYGAQAPLERHARTLLDGALRELDDTRPELVERVRSGYAHAVLAEESRSASLLVIGSRSAGASGPRTGAVAVRLLGRLTCPLVVVPS